MPNGRHARGRRGGARQGRRAAGFELLGHRSPTRSATAPSRRRFVVDVRDWVPRKLAALRCHRTQMGAEQPDRLDRRGRGAALARRRAVPPRAARQPAGDPMLEQLGELGPMHGLDDARHPALPVLRRPARRWSTSLFHRRSGDEIQDGILGCQCCIFPVVDGIPVLHLLPARDRGARSHRGRAGRISRGARCSASTTRRRPRRSTRVAVVRHRDLPRHRRGARAELRGRLFPLPLLRSRPTSSAQAVVARGRRGTVLGGGGRAIDICGGSGH